MVNLSRVPVRLNLAQSSQCSSLPPRSWFLLTGERTQTLHIMCETTREYIISHQLQTRNTTFLNHLNYIPREPTYSLGSWGAQEHLYRSDNLLSMQKRSKPCLLFGLPFPIIRQHFRRIHDVRLRFPRIMLDTITLPGNLVIGFRVLNAPKSMLKNRLHASYSRVPS